MEVRTSPKLAATHRTVKWLAFAMGVSMLLYAAVAEALLAVSPESVGLWRTDETLATLRGLAIGCAAVILLGSRLLRRRLTEGGDLGRMIDQVMIPGQRYREMMRAALLGFAACEAVAVIGLLLLLLSGRREDFYPFLGAGLICLVLSTPRFEQWQRWFQRRNSLR